jgi:hypothetical protein
MPTPLIDRKTLRGEWLSLVEKASIPKHTTQYQEMRRAFYAGAASYHTLTMTQMDAGEDATDEDMEYMSSLDDELWEFGELVQMGLA